MSTPLQRWSSKKRKTGLSRRKILDGSVFLEKSLLVLSLFPLDIAVHCRFGQMKLTGNLDDSALHLVDTGVHEIADDRSFSSRVIRSGGTPTALISLATMRGRISPTGVSMDSSVSSRAPSRL